ncbi:MAG: hypothetical protein ACI86M_002172 [Saprospiraceae bacterium]|jgi:hypothetical protein
MNNRIILIFISLVLGISCSEELAIEENLIGQWVY